MPLTNNLYTITCKTDSSIDILLADENHPVFAAHFPKLPILPSFLQLEIASEIFDIKITEIKKAKFIKTIIPQNKITFKKNNNKIIIESEEKIKISEIIYE
ncbi:hypothetical protein [Halarcobacter bivalviorum]|uniref:hypothetical protein n=1 Tax=Halarcobacter bivalviorum TaxID=663364 RepID=UPI00100A7C20|nr:hypothetical protein [Halarcobacter bivalviorum]RXK05721.1 hypothetical protein CRU97_07375 [Halarcobacter bivalviorum]